MRDDYGLVSVRPCLSKSVSVGRLIESLRVHTSVVSCLLWERRGEMRRVGRGVDQLFATRRIMELGEAVMKRRRRRNGWASGRISRGNADVAPVQSRQQKIYKLRQF